MRHFLLLESGATKLQWVVANAEQILNEGSQAGLHPFLSTAADWQHALLQLQSEIRAYPELFIYYYGSGCGQEVGQGVVHDFFSQILPGAYHLEVASDILAAARALKKDQAGALCILGTGSNVAYYDGRQITAQRGGLGYVLGDEGSGAHLGKILLQAFLNGQLPDSLNQYIKAELKLDRPTIISTVYQGSDPSRYLAQFAPVVKDWIDRVPYLQLRVKAAFDSFIRHYLLPLQSDYAFEQVAFTGSIAAHFTPLLSAALADFGIGLSHIEAAPLPSLISYHQELAAKEG